MNVWLWMLLAAVQGPFAVEVDVSSTEITLADEIVVTIDAHVPDGYALDIDSLYAGLDLRRGERGTFELVGETIEEISPEVQRITFVLEPWREVATWVGFLPAQFVSATGDVVTRFTEAFHVVVNPPTQPAALPKPAGPVLICSHDLLTVSEENRSQFQAATLHQQRRRLGRLNGLRRHGRNAVLALLLGAMVVWLWRKVRRSRTSPTILDPRQAALDALAQLQGQRLPQQGAFEPFYVTITAIVRRFLEECHGVRAPEQTTEEFLHIAAAHPTFNAATQSVLREFLSSADLVKFARHSPNMAQCDSAMDTAHQVVNC